jgi:TRAP-type C4-dicarboxylate transport system substrate-binding protein
MKKNSLLTLIELAVVALFIGSPLPVSSIAAPIELSYANFPPAPRFPCVQMERWKEEVEKRTGGKVAIKTFPGGTLLGAQNMMDGVITGRADIGCLSMASQPRSFIVTNAIALPVGFPNATMASLTLWDLYKKYRPREFAKVKALTMFTGAPANIYSKKQVKNLRDLKGLELKASGTVAQVLKALGATPIWMPQSETPEALQKGVVQGAASSLETLMDFKHAKFCRYVTIFNGPVYPFTVVMNLEKWNSLPKDIQGVMDDLGAEQALWAGNFIDKHVGESVEWSKKNYKIKITKLTERELARWNKLVKPVINRWITQAKAEGLPARAILRDVRVIKEYHSRF